VHSDQGALGCGWHARARTSDVFPSVQPGQLAATAHGIEAIAAGWDRTLAALKRNAEDTKVSDREKGHDAAVQSPR